MEDADKIINQLKSENLMAQSQGFDNLLCFTKPVYFRNVIESLIKKTEMKFDSLKLEEKQRLIKYLTLIAIALDGSCELRLNLQNKARHKDILKDDELQKFVQDIIFMLEKFESKDKNLVSGILESEKARLSKILLTRGVGFLAAKAKNVPPTTSIRKWIDYWSDTGKKTNLRKFRESCDGLLGVDYGLGVIECRILYGADLVMMNPTLARMALAEDDELQNMKKEVAKKYSKVWTREQLVREATKIAGLKARYAMRAVFLLTGRGKVSFQVNPKTYNQPDKLENDIRTLHAEFNKEATEYDSGLSLDEVMTKDEIKQRKGQSNVFYKVDGSCRGVYGNIENIMLKQVKEKKLDLTKDDSGGVIEKVLTDGMNCNVTVAGFVTDGLWSFLCQIRGHAKAAKKRIPISHSIITKMGGRVEGALRWLVLQKLAGILKEKNDPKLDEVLKTEYAKNGPLDNPSLRKIAKEAGLILPEEIKVSDYNKYSGKLFPQDIAICTIAEAISKRSHKIIIGLKKSDILKKQGVKEWETGDLQAAVRPPYGGRFPHVEELAGMYAQGHFPDIALSIDTWENFNPDPNNINKPVNPDMISQLYNSIIAEEFASAYEVDDSLKEILVFFEIYENDYGSRGIKIKDLCRHPFAQQTLFGELLGEAGEEIPSTEEEKDKIRKGFIGDFNILGEELTVSI